MPPVRPDAGFLLVEALIAVALLALSATVIVAISSNAIKASGAELDESAAWSVMEALALELGRFGAESPRATGSVVTGPYHLQVVRLSPGSESLLETHEIRAGIPDVPRRDLVMPLYAPAL